MSIRVTDFKWEKGKNDVKYIELLEKTLKNEQVITARAVAKIRILVTENEKLKKEKQEIRAKTIDEFAEAIRDIHYKYPIGTDADTNEPLYGHEDGTWHNLLDDVAEQMKSEIV